MPDLSIFDTITVDKISQNLSNEDIAELDSYQRHFEQAVNLLLQNRARVRAILSLDLGPDLKDLPKDNPFCRSVTALNLRDKIQSEKDIEYRINSICNSYEDNIYKTVSKRTPIEHQPHSLALARIYGVPEESCKSFYEDRHYSFKHSSSSHREFGGYRLDERKQVPETVSFPDWRDVVELIINANGGRSIKDINLQNFIDEWRSCSPKVPVHFRIAWKGDALRISDLLSYSTGGYGRRDERTLGTYGLNDFLRFVSIFEGSDKVDFLDPLDCNNVRWTEPYRLCGADDIRSVSFTKNAMMDILFKDRNRAEEFYRFCTTSVTGEPIEARLAENKPKKSQFTRYGYL